MFAAAIGGVPGVLHAMTLLKEEIHRDMALARGEPARRADA